MTDFTEKLSIACFIAAFIGLGFMMCEARDNVDTWQNKPVIGYVEASQL